MTSSDTQFDLVRSWGVVHHSAGREKLARQVYGVPNPGGAFRFMADHRRSLSGLYCLLRGFLSGKLFRGMSADEVLSIYTDNFLASFYTRDERKEILARCGSTDVRIRMLDKTTQWISLPGAGAVRSRKSAHVSGISGRPEGRLLSVADDFLFARATKDSRATPEP